MVEDIPKSTGKQPKYPEAPLLFISGTLTAAGRGGASSARPWAAGEPVLSQQEAVGRGLLSPLAGFPQRRQPVQVELRLCVSGAWVRVELRLCVSGAGVQVELHLCPQVSFCFWWCEAVCYNLGSKKQTLPRLLIYLFAEGDKYH